MLYCRELFGIQIRYGIREDCSGTRLFPCREFHAQEFDKIGTASLITRTTNDITQVQQVTIMILRMMAIAPMMYRGIVMAVSRPGLTTVLLIVLPILALAIFLIAKKGFRSSKRSR